MSAVTRLLVANRGEIACRIIRTARAMGISTVAVHSEPDADALHVAAADVAAPLGGAAPAESYLDVEAVLAAARRTGADSVHPGYGFLAESAQFARTCAEAGLTFVGPSPEVVAASGDKLAAKAAARAAGVPVLDTYPADAVPPEAYPVLLKAAAGGGGKGMRAVDTAAELSDALASARREAEAAFGDDTVFVERLVRRPRHVEVQILGDVHGNLVHLGERDCSVQRRFQKVIEESPSPAVNGQLRVGLCQAALTVGRALAYTNAGTVEFILDDNGSFYFLEVNARLQVEHPVTELAWAVRGRRPLDLVREQIRVARGEPLGFEQQDVIPRGHAIEARLYAEDPAAGFLPSAGIVAVFDPAVRPGVRFDTGVRAGSVVGVEYDPLLAKVIAHAEERGEATALLSAALERTRVQGVAHNRDLLVAVLRSPAFLAGDVTTGFLDQHFSGWSPGASPERNWWHPAAAALAGALRRRASAHIHRGVPSGWRNNWSQPQRVAYQLGEARVDIGYRRLRDGTWSVSVDGEERAARIHGLTGQELDLEVGAVRHRLAVVDRDGRVYVDSALGATALADVPRFPVPRADDVPGSLRAPMPGTVLSIPVERGARVSAGDTLLVLEAMKMEHPVTAPRAGTVEELLVGPGALVAAGDVLVVLTPGQDASDT